MGRPAALRESLFRSSRGRPAKGRGRPATQRSGSLEPNQNTVHPFYFTTPGRPGPWPVDRAHCVPGQPAQLENLLKNGFLPYVRWTLSGT